MASNVFRSEGPFRLSGRAARAGADYFALVFLIGFVLGTVRTLAVEPWIGPLGATLVELPVILAASWIACSWLVDLYEVPASPAPRFVMGGVALLLLLAAEFTLAVALMGENPADYVASLVTPARALGFSGQVLFAAFPLLSLFRSTA